MEKGCTRPICGVEIKERKRQSRLLDNLEQTTRVQTLAELNLPPSGYYFLPQYNGEDWLIYFDQNFYVCWSGLKREVLPTFYTYRNYLGWMHLLVPISSEKASMLKSLWEVT